jgi:hypothetical protein
MKITDPVHVVGASGPTLCRSLLADGIETGLWCETLQGSNRRHGAQRASMSRRAGITSLL